ncbi:Clock-controlled protein 8 [Colletotrichum shisoi]|uniref:Clock-controlled protein 8 n=1 Tax=Colletotrichum shisoi TaxID=2078593 RepID=A0A5Q4BVL3_9PEZI|nr:Clock-controlled protein 8 [Colletotrichum shisoi]
MDLSQSMSRSQSQNHMLHGPAPRDRQLPPSSSSVALHSHTHHHVRPLPPAAAAAGTAVPSTSRTGTTATVVATTAAAAAAAASACASAPASTNVSSIPGKHVLSHARFDPTHISSQLPSYAPAPSYTHTPSHDPNLLSFSDAPTTELAPILPAAKHTDNGGHTLPSLSSVTGPPPPRFPPITSSQPIEQQQQQHQQQQQQQHRRQQQQQPPLSPPTSPQHQQQRQQQQSLPKQTQSHPPSLVRSKTTTVPVTHWPSLNPLTTYYTPSHAQSAGSPARMDLDVSSNAAMSAASPDRFYEGRAASVSLDDPDVRMAAEALGDLRADFINSPPARHTPLPRASPSVSITSNPQTNSEEPLFSLLTTSHPLLATTIEGATSAYNNSKNFSPRFKSSAEYVEGYLTPIANTVGTVGRKTGVEGGVRWFLGAGRRHQSTDLEAADGGSHKRRKVDTGEDLARLMIDAQSNVMPDVDSPRDPYVFKHDRRLSRASTIDTLPAYDDYRSPAYTENEKSERPTSSNAAWQSRLIMSTSGLSVAMSEESLRSLKYCLRWLRWANEHIGGVINNLKSTLEQYEKTGDSQQGQEPEVSSDGDHVMIDGQPDSISEQDRTMLAARIASLKGDVLKTLRDVIETVSKYAGGALPDNARTLVRRHLTTLPQRFRYASMVEQQQGEKTGEQAREEAMREGAHRVLVLAKEGLDMMAQVSGVLDGTIVSAEEWCERLGKKKRDQREAVLPQSQPQEVDVKIAPA